MDPTAQALLFALLGAVLGGGTILAWRISEIQYQRTRKEAEPVLSEGVAGVLSVLRSSAVVVDGNDDVISATAPAYALGLVKDDRVAVDELAQIVRAVRRDGQIRESELRVARPGQRTPRLVTVRVAPLDSRLVLALVEDRTRERQVEAIRRDFVANVSHELKTPVGAIKLLAEAVTNAADDPDAVHRFAGRMGLEADRLTRLVQQIIELSRLQSDVLSETAQTVDVDRLLERAIDEHATDAATKELNVVRDGDKGLQIFGDTEQIALAVGNLVSNAVTYSPEGSSILVGARPVENTVEISVTDQGIGIPEGELDRIFERFYRVDPARHRSTGGTGLGLSIVKHVAASHGGDVRVWSVEGQGSTFTISLPRKQEVRS